MLLLDGMATAPTERLKEFSHVLNNSLPLSLPYSRMATYHETVVVNILRVGQWAADAVLDVLHGGLDRHVARLNLASFNTPRFEIGLQLLSGKWTSRP